ncbi:conserved hypothetical protein [Histoplasma mississippiense (nom. inval.)]|uniref:conserved hypothetical protein n=1 Tax=Ajellomyces capsulatus (strain NAm1 / WU24) TaxID=2059318 RepID=UPI000157C9A9|nr:conserved hypothetical protein [Histoplasma mississippiense (nom. inval.)]EDN09477.1 conserved hypothetical protein [Histoplasma mississippiense (nom. inval.)]
MVSHPDAPASVASSSRVSHSQRRHHSHSYSHHNHSRSGRLHHGGSTHQPLNQFPIFAATGDVEIVIRTSEEWSRSQALREAQMLEGVGNAANTAAITNGIENGNSTTEHGLAIITDEDAAGAGAGEELVAHHRRASSARTKTRWRYELDWVNREEDEMPILVQKPASQNNSIFGGSYRPPKPPPARTKPPPPQQGFFRSITSLTGIQSALHLPSTATSTAATKPAIEDGPLDPTIRDYDNLFRIFYNYPPQLNAINIASAYSECKSLLNLADMYDALPVVGPRVDHHLLRFSSRLYKQIAKYPPSYLRLGYLARSHVIFAEALIHVVGQWPAALPHLGQGSYSPLPDPVLDLIEDKVEDMEELKARVEGKLFRLSLTTSRGERRRVPIITAILHRQLQPPPPPPPPTMTMASAGAANNKHYNQISNPSPYSPGRTYRLIGSPSNQAYLPHDELKRFLKQSHTHSHDSLYSRENLKRFERKMDEIKRLAREIVKPLMRHFLELDLRSLSGSGGGGLSAGTDDAGGGVLLPYLTCTRVEEGDYPWD